MSNNIKVSIVVCSYNQEKYIRQTLDSIVYQEHPYTWELIVCDDASKDSTHEIINDYASIHPEVIPILRNENLGLIKNYFDGISRCRGEYIMVCAGDDYWLPDKVKNQVPFMEQNPDLGLSYSGAITINERGEKIGVINSNADSSFETLLKANHITAGTICMRSSLIQDYINEISPLSHSWKMEDYPILLWFARNSKIGYLKGEYFAYRMLDQSVSHHTQLLPFCEFIKSAYDIKCYFCEKYLGSRFIDEFVDKISYYLLNMHISILKKNNQRESIRLYRKVYMSELKKHHINPKQLAWYLAPKFISNVLSIKFAVLNIKNKLRSHNHK